MQCSECRAVYSNGLDICPRCKTPASVVAATIAATEPSDKTEKISELGPAEIDDKPPIFPLPTVKKSSTLIEFPGARSSVPQWRKQLSERVREIQDRRAKEAELELHLETANEPHQAEIPKQQPGLLQFQLPELPEVNPIVTKALQRVERARRQQPLRSRNSGSTAGAATALARAPRQNSETSHRPAPAAQPALPVLKIERPEPIPSSRPIEILREPEPEPVPLIVPLPIIAEDAEPVQGRSDFGASPLSMFAVEEVELAVVAETQLETRAPSTARFVAGVIDLIVVAFAASPFAAVIELANGNWSDWRIQVSTIGIILIVMFFYLTAAIALAGRTWGMSVLSLRVVKNDTFEAPTTKQCVGRAIAYMLSLATLGIGFLFSLFDSNGRALHDRLSGTSVVPEYSHLTIQPE